MTSSLLSPQPATASFTIDTLKDVDTDSTRPEEDYAALPLRPWIDLATLALLAESGELIAAPSCEGDHPTLLSVRSMTRLSALSGERPEHFWADLLHYGVTLNLFDLRGDLWGLRSRDSEILGATRRECFPAMLAAWLKAPAPIPELAEMNIDQRRQMSFRMDLMRFITQLGSNRWYPYDDLSRAIDTAARKHDVALSDEFTTRLTRVLAERVFLVLGAVSINTTGDHFIPRSDIHTPVHCANRREDKFRDAVAQQFEKDQSWRRVATGLWRCIEVRRARQAGPTSVRCLDDQGHLETDPRLPFRDCLFLASFGRLIPNTAVDAALNDPGRYVFELDLGVLRRRLEEGLELDEIAEFLQTRCADEGFSRIEPLLSASSPS